jgi:putative DNA methylase
MDSGRTSRAVVENSAKHLGQKAKLPRVLIEDWLPAAAIGVECMRERGSASALAPHTYLHVWWARRPLTVSRAAVLASLLPANFPRDVFEKLLGFGLPGTELVRLRRIMDSGVRLGGFPCKRAFKAFLSSENLELLRRETNRLWGTSISVIDPMAGGGSIPLESARLGFKTQANEYNPVACSVLEATVDYPFRYGAELGTKARKWGQTLRKRFNARVERFFPKTAVLDRPDGYIFARTVPCPDTKGHPPTPLVPDWHLLHPKGGGKVVVAEPLVDGSKRTWSVRIRTIGQKAGQLHEPPQPTYIDGKGISLFTHQQISADYIKAKAQAGEMKNALYAVVIKTPQGLTFQPPDPRDVKVLNEAEKELAMLRPEWEKANIVPTELYPAVSSDERPRLYGMPRWADMFSPRQLLCFGVLMEELRRLREEVLKAEGSELGEAIVHLLAFVIDKFANYNSVLASWHAPRAVIRSVFDRHDFSFKAAFTELAACKPNMGVDWAVDNTIEAYEQIAKLPRAESIFPVEISLGSATNLPHINDCSITAVIVDPPYADNVQYSELADFFYVWLKRTQGLRRPEWFSTYLCEHDKEAVVNINRHREIGTKPSKKGKRDGSTAEARAKAHTFYQGLMSDMFKECRRILRDDGVLTVMFTHKKQEAWEALFTSLISAGFTITATWPVKTESEHSLHQAKKNAAQSTVLLVARKRPAQSGVGYFDSSMKHEIQEKARSTAQRLQEEMLNPVDQLVGSFGPAMEVYSRYDEVRTDTGDPVSVDKAIDEASNAVSQWRIDQLAARGLGDVEPEGRFTLLCWDVLGAAEFRFNEAKLLGNAVGMDVDQLVTAGLVTKSGDKIRMVPAKDRRRDRALEPDEMNETLFGSVTVPKKRTKKQTLKIHPNDPQFRTALDACHALALRYIEAKGGAAGIGSAKALVRQQNWNKDSAVARLMQALVKAAPEAVRHEKGKNSAAALFPEFRAWHALLEPLFGMTPPDWTEKAPPQGILALQMPTAEEPEDEESEAADNGEE